MSLRHRSTKLCLSLEVLPKRKIQWIIGAAAKSRRHSASSGARSAAARAPSRTETTGRVPRLAKDSPRWHRFLNDRSVRIYFARSRPIPCRGMIRLRTIVIVSDIHYACDAEQRRRGHEARIIPNPLLRRAVKAYRHHVWLRDPFAHNHLLDDFLARADSPDLVVTNGDYSCDTAFIGVSDDAAFESARQCLTKLRDRFGPKLHCVIGDHELGKVSLFGGKGGFRLASWRRATIELALQPFWKIELGNYVLMGVTSSLLAFPVYAPEALPAERSDWKALRGAHLAQIRQAFDALKPDQRVLLFCHDPTALPFLWRDSSVRGKLPQLEHTIIGHLHSNLFFRKSRLLAGMPTIRFLGNSIRRMNQALNEARCWREFKARLCPSMAGIELLKDGGYCELRISEDASCPPEFHFHPLRR